MPLTVSVIIPTLDEAARVGPLVAALRRQDRECEIIVVDGGSADGTIDAARAAGTRVVETARGRGRQLRAGAALARGDVLLFLHADTRFPGGGLAAIRQALRDTGTEGGNFRVLFDGDDGFSRWLTGFYAWFRGKGLYYGDSAVFVRRVVYGELGGIRPIEVMEDYDFTRRLERRGRTVCVAEPAVITSSRRFAGRSPVAIVLQWLYLHALYHLGTSPALLARLYDSDRRRRAGGGC